MIKKLINYIIFFSIGIILVYATNNYFRFGNNWDANVSTTELANDIFYFSGRLNLEDSRSNEYINKGYRGTLSGWINSPLFGDFYTLSPFILKFNKKYTDSDQAKTEINNKCYNGGSWDGIGPIPELYSISGAILSHGNGENIWGDFYTHFYSNSFFCSNKIIYLNLESNTIGKKELGTGVIQGVENDDFLKQEIYIQGIANINGNTNTGILARGNQEINEIKVYLGYKALIKKNINKNISIIYNNYLNSVNGNLASGDIIQNFNNSRDKENYYIYNYSGKTEDITFNGNIYINKGKNLIIDESNSDNITNVNGINTVIVNGGNIYIKSDIQNTNDNKDLLILIAKKDKINGNGGNIYIDPNITNIDAILIADGSLISLYNNEIQSILDVNQKNNLRKQLLIYGKILSSNNIGTNKIPFGADLYENSNYSNNEMLGNIYDLGNLRTFNLNYGGGDSVISGCNNENKLTPIKTGKFSWAGRKECYNNDPNQYGLKGNNKFNPLIIYNNSNIKFLNPFILQIK